MDQKNQRPIGLAELSDEDLDQTAGGWWINVRVSLTEGVKSVSGGLGTGWTFRYDV
jgi:hypothetical protein